MGQKDGQSFRLSISFQAPTHALTESMPMKMTASAQRRRSKPTKGPW